MNLAERLAEIEQTARGIGRGNQAKDVRAFAAIGRHADALNTNVQPVYIWGVWALGRAASAHDKAAVCAAVQQIKDERDADERRTRERLQRRIAARA